MNEQCLPYANLLGIEKFEYIKIFLNKQMELNKTKNIKKCVFSLQFYFGRPIALIEMFIL